LGWKARWIKPPSSRCAIISIPGLGNLSQR
jgi:hypothetical protein